MAENLFGHGRKDKSKATLKTGSVLREEINADKEAGRDNCPKKFGTN